MQTQTVPLTIGADVAKDEIVVACEEQYFAPHGIANRRPALVAFLKTLPPGSRIGMESTGDYHELFATLAHQMGFVVYVLNPKDTRHYAKGVGQRGKTDRVDAKLMPASSTASMPSCMPGYRPLRSSISSTDCSSDARNSAASRPRSASP